MKMTLVLLLVSLFSSCSDKNGDEIIISPTNLQFVTEVVGAKVNVTATALNANYYTVDFGISGSMVNVKDGKASYTYLNSGTYLVTVKAYATAAVAITSTKEITIALTDTPITDEGYSTPDHYTGYTLVWKDEFEGTAVDASNWTFETGTATNGWGNHELQYYRQENTEVKDGYLIITAKKEAFNGMNYTSSRLITKGKQEFQYGRADIRAKLPKGQGIWPALWMLGANVSTVDWPSCGELDIMEMIGGQGRENTVYGTLHWEEAGHKCTCDKPGKTLASGTFADKFYVFSIIWDADNIKWYVDDQLFNTISITPAALNEFHEKFFFIMNLAVGGDWPGSPDANTTFPQQMTVDYIRMFQEE
jgi:beta-glucanase (GH16 family)